MKYEKIQYLVTLIGQRIISIYELTMKRELIEIPTRNEDQFFTFWWLSLVKIFFYF